MTAKRDAHTSKWGNILNAALNPAKARVMAGKLWHRISDTKGSISSQQNLSWLAKNATNVDAFLVNAGTELQQETNKFVRELEAHARSVLATIPYDLGGGGGVPLLYAVTRMRKPHLVVETGVAAGFSSASFLTALDINGDGMLYSSDFPYFRIAEPEKYVGIVVPENLKSRWSLHLIGDSANLPRIISLLQGKKIDIFHYDSDKSYDGRRFALETVCPHLAEDGLIIMDDIQDNAFFHDWAVRHPTLPWSILAYQGKYIGILGKI